MISLAMSAIASSETAIKKTSDGLSEKSSDVFTSAWYNLSVRAAAFFWRALNTSLTTKPALSIAGAKCQARFPDPMKETVVFIS